MCLYLLTPHTEHYSTTPGTIPNRSIQVPVHDFREKMLGSPDPCITVHSCCAPHVVYGDRLFACVFNLSMPHREHHSTIPWLIYLMISTLSTAPISPHYLLSMEQPTLWGIFISLVQLSCVFARLQSQIHTHQHPSYERVTFVCYFLFTTLLRIKRCRHANVE
jgi:hypothetical protein